MADWIIREIRAFGTGEKEKGEEEEEALQLATTISVEHFESTDTGMCRYVCRSNFSVVCILGKMFFAAECNKWRALVLIRSRDSPAQKRFAYGAACQSADLSMVSGH